MRAGVSSFGVGGTNVHLALEEAPLPEMVPPVPVPQVNAVQILPLSARSPEALEALRDRLAAVLETGADGEAGYDAPALADIAFTLQEGRGQYPWRISVAAETRTAAAALLRKTARPATATGGTGPRIAFMFPGQGAQYPGMGAGLCRQEPEFAR